VVEIGEIGEHLRQEFARDDAALQAALTSGPDVFLAWLVGFLRRTVGAKLAFVGEFSGEDRDRVRTLSVVSSEGPQPNFEYDLRGTPCARVGEHKTCVHSRGVAVEFPDDRMLADMGIESYAGVPLIDTGDHALGLAVLLGDEPMSAQVSQLALGLLELFRPRLEAVLSKRRVLRELQMAVEGTTDATSEGALNHLAGALAQAMRVRSVFVSEMVDPEGGRLRSLAMTIDSKAVDEIVYDMAGTPCEAVYSEGHAFYPRSVCSEFPGDSFLRGLHAESYAGVLFRDPDGAPIGHLALVHDRELTENPTEQSLFQIFAARVGAELQRRRAEHARIAAERRLLEGQKLESLGLMASGIAHDFNNMLVAILGNADLAHARVEPGSETHDLLGEIVTASRRAGDLSRELLLFSGQRARDMRPVDLNAIVRDTTGLIQVSISKRCRMNQALAERLPAIAADPSQLQRIAMNLITNASEAVGDAEGTISIGSGTRHCTRMELDSWGLGADLDEGEYVYLEVRDTGVGMNSETQRRIFDPFFSTKGQSRGLGLAALLGIVRAHGGAIQVESREGIGTAFTVYLPPVYCQGGGSRSGRDARSRDPWHRAGPRSRRRAVGASRRRRDARQGGIRDRASG